MNNSSARPPTSGERSVNRIEYVRNGRVVACIGTAGRLLRPTLPHGLTYEASAAGDLRIHEPADRSLAGRLTMPCTVEGTLTFVDLHVPSNGRFNQLDLRLLWEAGAELARWRSARSAQLDPAASFGAPHALGEVDQLRDWRSLAACAGYAKALLSRWPASLDRRPIWLPLGVPGGSEDVPMTGREVERQGFVAEREGVLAVTQSARWVGERRPLVSGTIAALAQQVIRKAETTVGGSEAIRLRPWLAPIEAVGKAASAPTAHRDPDASSWPSSFREFASACFRVIVDLESQDRGTGVVPLLDTDELYEAWLAIQVRDAMNRKLGAHDMPASDALASWSADEILFELWVQPRVPKGKGRRFGLTQFMSVVATLLTPDLVISASRDEETALLVLDAKSWSSMTPEQVLEQSAKYMYGIRRYDDAQTVPALASVDLVTSATTPAISHGPSSHVQVTTATPTAGLEALSARVTSLVSELTLALEERERLASE